MAAPLAVAAPAAAALASLAYLNARSSFSYDLALLRTVVRSTLRIIRGQKRGRLNFFYLIEDHARDPRRAGKPFLVFEGATHTYAQTYDRVLRYAAWLRSRLGVRPGDVVAMDFQNSDAYVFVWLALWAVGAKPAFINYNLRGKPLAHSVRAASTKLCLIDPNVASSFDDGVREELSGSDVKLMVFTPEIEAQASSSPPIRPPDADRAEDNAANMALLIYTSGTTGLPKPAVVSWAKCYYGGTAGETLLGRGGDDIMYTSMPLYHSSAAILSLCATILAGSTQALGRKFSAKLFWDEVRASKATMIQYVGETLRYLLAAPPQRDPVTGECLDTRHRVQLAFGNGLRPDVWSRFKDRFGVATVVEFYAATESPGATWNVSNNGFSAGAIGRAGWLYGWLFGRDLAIVEVDWDADLPRRDPRTGFCARVRPGQPGEMLFRLPPRDEDMEARFQGYYNNPSATRAKVLRDVFARGDAWFRTGDVIRRDSDGRVFFSDRIGDTFRWKSENVSTAEVSQALGLHPSVREANVYGVQLPHHDGRAGCVALCLDGSGSGSDPDEETLRSLAAHVRASLPRYARPLFLRLVRGVAADGHTTGTNKQQKNNLRAAGVKPVSGSDEMIYWLRGDSYVPFREEDWRELEGGRVKL